MGWTVVSVVITWYTCYRRALPAERAYSAETNNLFGNWNKATTRYLSLRQIWTPAALKSPVLAPRDQDKCLPVLLYRVSEIAQDLHARLYSVLSI